MRKILPILLLLIGVGSGAAAGWFLQPAAEPSESQPAEAASAGGDGAAQGGAQYTPPPANTEAMRLPNQFIVPLIEDGQVQAMVVIGIALELVEGHEFSLTRDEPRLRAVFLQVLFDHANIGGFDGVFTSGEALLALRRTLREAAQSELGPKVHDVLITELMRQAS